MIAFTGQHQGWAFVLFEHFYNFGMRSGKEIEQFYIDINGYSGEGLIQLANLRAALLKKGRIQNNMVGQGAHGLMLHYIFTVIRILIGGIG
ncbi:hypothetical protein D3C79_907880 [compost metagenome]